MYCSAGLENENQEGAGNYSIPVELEASAFMDTQHTTTK